MQPTQLTDSSNVQCMALIMIRDISAHQLSQKRVQQIKEGHIWKI